MDTEALRVELAQLRQEHRDLDVAVEALAATPNHDDLQLQRLKKKKLMIKDRIMVLEDQLRPDIIA
ncbi:MAG: YdcH family protein [Labrenzia sp.]